MRKNTREKIPPLQSDGGVIKSLEFWVSEKAFVAGQDNTTSGPEFDMASATSLEFYRPQVA